MPNLHIEFNPTGGNNFTVGYRPDPITYGSVEPFIEVPGFTTSPIDIHVPLVTAYEFYIRKICRRGGISNNVTGIAYPQTDCLKPTLTFISRVGSDFNFSYILAPNQLLFQIQVYSPDGQLLGFETFYSSINPSPFTYSLSNITNGVYRFRIRGICGPNKFSPMSAWSDYVDSTVITSGCTQPSSIIEQLCNNVVITNPSDIMPDATVGVPYSFTLNIVGDTPINLGVDILPIPPSWMTVTHVNSGVGMDTIEFTGTPLIGDTGLSKSISVRISNCSNSLMQGVNYIGTFNVGNASVNQLFLIQNVSPDDYLFRLSVNNVFINYSTSVQSGTDVSLNASGGVINNPSSTVYLILLDTNIPASASILFQGNTVIGTLDSLTSTYTFIGVDTSITQTLIINLT